MTTAISTVEDSRLCEQCYETKPITDFRCTKRGTETRARDCRACHNETERLRQERHREKGVDRTLAQFSAKMTRARDEQRVTLIVAETVHYFGGLQKFMDAWKLHGDQAMNRTPGSKKVLDFFSAMVRMMDATSQYQQFPDPNDLSNEDLAFALEHQVRELIEREPEIAVSALENMGWAVIRTNNSEMG